MHTQVRHFTFLNLDIDTRLPFAVNIHAAHSVDIEHRPPYQFGIIHHFLIAESVGSHGIKHTVHIPEIIEHHRGLSPCGQLRLHISHLPAKNIPILLQLIQGNSAPDFHQYFRHIVHRTRLDMIEVSHGPDRFFQHIRYLQFYLISRSPGISGNDHRLFYSDRRVFQFTHRKK